MLPPLCLSSPITIVGKDSILLHKYFGGSKPPPYVICPLHLLPASHFFVIPSESDGGISGAAGLVWSAFFIFALLRYPFYALLRRALSCGGGALYNKLKIYQSFKKSLKPLYFYYNLCYNTRWLKRFCVFRCFLLRFVHNSDEPFPTSIQKNIFYMEVQTNDRKT